MTDADIAGTVGITLIAISSASFLYKAYKNKNVGPPEPDYAYIQILEQWHAYWKEGCYQDGDCAHVASIKRNDMEKEFKDRMAKVPCVFVDNMTGDR